MTEACNYGDDATEWFESNYLKLNLKLKLKIDKFRFLYSVHKYKTLFANIGEAKIGRPNIKNF